MPAASSATQLNPAAASTEGPEPTDCARSARSAVTADRDGAGWRRAAAVGPTSVPTGLTFPSTGEAPVQQALARIDLGQRRAVQQAHDQRDAVPPGHPDVGGATALVQPILPPNAPGYVASSEFWFHRPTDFFLLIRNWPLVVWSYSEEGLSICSPCRANSARS